MASASSGSRAAKRQRWQERGPNDKQIRLSQFAALRCSESSLAAIVKVLRKQPELIDEIEVSPLAEAAQAFSTHLCRQPVELQMEDGPTSQWHVADLGQALAFFAKHSENFRGLLPRCYRDHPCSPENHWNAIVYNDEAVLGAVLRLDNRRKMACFYVTMKEWGVKALCREAAWLPLAYIRHDIVMQVVGKLSAVAKAFLRHMFLSADSVMTSGAVVDGIGEDGQAALIFAKLGNLSFDESACNATLSTKGANGLFPCVYCKNVHNRPRDDMPLAAYDATGNLVDITCPDPRLFDARSNGDWWFAADLLSELHPRLTRGQFEEQERLLGLTYNPQGLLWDLELRRICPPISVQTYDPAHCFLCSGLAQKEIGLLLNKLKDAGMGFATIRTFMEADWRTCGCFGGKRAPSKFASVFSKARDKHWRKSLEFGCGANELLDIVAPFRYFLEMQGDGFRQVFNREVASFCALADCIALLTMAKDGLPVADELAQKLHRHALRFVAAYGDDDLTVYIPKFHFARHIPAQIRRDGFLIDTLACERYHTRTKNVADPIKNTARLESSVLGRALQSHLALVNSPDCFGSALLQASDFDDFGDGAKISLNMVWDGMRLTEDDVIRLDGCPHMVRGCVEYQNRFVLLTQEFRFVEQVTPAAGRWQKLPELRVEPLDGRLLRLAVCWTEEADGILLVDRG